MPVGTCIVAVLAIAVFIYTHVFLSDMQRGDFFIAFGLRRSSIFTNFGDSWHTLITHTLVHADFMHLVGNLAFLLTFSPGVEARLRWFFLPVFIGMGAFAGVLSLAFSYSPDVNLIGASGAISGIMGAFVVLLPERDIRFIAPGIVLLRLGAALWTELTTFRKPGAPDGDPDPDFETLEEHTLRASPAWNSTPSNDSGDPGRNLFLLGSGVIEGVNATFYVLAWFGYQLSLSIGTPFGPDGTAYIAHVLGLIAGYALVLGLRFGFGWLPAEKADYSAIDPLPLGPKRFYLTAVRPLPPGEVLKPSDWTIVKRLRMTDAVQAERALSLVGRRLRFVVNRGQIIRFFDLEPEEGASAGRQV